MTRIVFSLVMCLILTSEAQAVRLMDGAAVGQMFGYVAACAKNVGMNPPATQEDKQVGEKYGMWLQNNGGNVTRVVNDLQNNLGIGMAAAARSNYSNCASVLREMIGFHEFFKSKGTSLYPILKKYTNTVQSHQPQVPNIQQSPAKGEVNGLLAFDYDQSKPPAYTLGKYAAPEGATGELNLYITKDGSTAIEVTVSSEADGSMCKFSGLCTISNGKIECDNLEDKADAFASLIGTVSKNSIEITNGKMYNVCDPRADMVGVYKFKAAPVDDEENMGPALPLGTLALKDNFTSSTMKLRFNEDGDLLMVIKSISTDKVKCVFEGMCDVINGTKLECRQYVGDKEVYAAGDFTDTTIEIIPSSTKSICPKDGVIDGTYMKK